MTIIDLAPPKLLVFAHHAQGRGQVQGSTARVFELLHDHTRLAADMNQRSWHTGWSHIVGGLDPMDRKLFDAVIQRVDGGSVGLDNMAAAIDELPGTFKAVAVLTGLRA